jgi:RNA recognition motif-containing protein
MPQFNRHDAQVKHVYLPIDTDSKSLRGIAFVAFNSVADAKAAVIAVKDFMWPTRYPSFR